MKEEGKIIKYRGRAFLSCSLRDEDSRFIEGIENILKAHDIEPFGTVGKYSASPTNVAKHMKDNIPKADMVVIVATPRYLQKDLKTGKISQGLSEMVHVETGMAYMSDKPVIAFVKKGTEIGNFLPNITQYIILDETESDLKKKWNLITSLIENAWKLVIQKKNKEGSVNFTNFITAGLAFVGTISLISSIFSSSKSED